MRCHWKKWVTVPATQCKREATSLIGPSVPPIPYCDEHAESVKANRIAYLEPRGRERDSLHKVA